MKNHNAKIVTALSLLIILLLGFAYVLGSRDHALVSPQAKSISLPESQPVVSSAVATNQIEDKTSFAAESSVTFPAITNREELIALASRAQPIDPFAKATTPEFSANDIPILESKKAFSLSLEDLKRAGYSIYLDYPGITRGDSAPRVQLVGGHSYRDLHPAVADNLLEIQLPEISTGDSFIIQVDYLAEKSIRKSRYLLKLND